MTSPAITAFRRQMLERWIEDAIALLDRMDGDPDFEPEPLEPDLADAAGDIEHDEAEAA